MISMKNNDLKRGQAIGIDVGGTNIKAGLVNQAGKVLEAQVIPTEKEKGADYVLQKIAQLINDLSGSTVENIAGVGVALPGDLDYQQGYCLYCPNLQWGKLEISERLASSTGFSVQLINDANAACLGEYFYGKGKGAKNFLSITLGTGVGSGLILAESLFTGRFGSGVEAGHMIIEPHGFPCSCGGRGCWETLVSASALVRRMKERIKGNPSSKLFVDILNKEDTNINAVNNLEQAIISGISPEMIFQAYRQGDLLAQAVVEETIYYLAIGLANLINLFHPCQISLGGGLAEAEEIMSANLIEQINNNVFPTLKGKVEIYKATQGYYGGVVGAAALWLQNIKTI